MLSYLATAEEHVSEGGINPYVIGGIALAIFVILMLALLSFGKGREHS